MMALVLAAVAHGYGLYLEDIIDPSDREQALMYTFVAPPFLSWHLLWERCQWCSSLYAC